MIFLFLATLSKQANVGWRKVLTKELIDTDDALSIRKTYVGGKWKLSRQGLLGGLQKEFNG